MANFSITIVEYLNRTNPGGFSDTIIKAAPFIVLGQVGLYFAWRGAPSMLVAWAFFAAGSSAMRLVSTHYLVGEQADWRQFIVVCMMFGCAYLMKRCG